MADPADEDLADGPLAQVWFPPIRLTPLSELVAAAGAALPAQGRTQGEELLGVWIGHFITTADPPDDPGTSPLLSRLAARAMTDLYKTRRIVLAELVEEQAQDAGLSEPDQAALAHDTDAWAGSLEGLGALLLDDGVAHVTPLGRHGIRVLLSSLGALAPAIDPQELSAEEVLSLPEVQDADDDLDVAAEWAAGRDPVEAAEELLAAAVDLGTASARIAVRGSLEGHLVGLAGPAIERHLDHPLLGPHLRAVLAEPDVLPSPQDEVLLLIDGLAATFVLYDPPIRRDDLPLDAWTITEALLEIPDVWTVPHPELLLVLDGIAEGHPRNRVRKVAAKAAHKYRRRALGEDVQD